MTNLIDVNTLTAAQRQQLFKDLEAAQINAHAGDVETARVKIDGVLKDYNVSLDETHPLRIKAARKKKSATQQQEIYFNPANPEQKTSGVKRRPAWLDEQILSGNADKCLLKDPATGKPFKHTLGVLKALQDKPKASTKSK